MQQSVKVRSRKVTEKVREEEPHHGWPRDGVRKAHRRRSGPPPYCYMRGDFAGFANQASENGRWGGERKTVVAFCCYDENLKRSRTSSTKMGTPPRQPEILKAGALDHTIGTEGTLPGGISRQVKRQAKTAVTAAKERRRRRSTEEAGGDYIDETARPEPKQSIVEQGLHPHPGTVGVAKRYTTKKPQIADRPRRRLTCKTKASEAPLGKRGVGSDREILEGEPDREVRHAGDNIDIMDSGVGAEHGEVRDIEMRSGDTDDTGDTMGRSHGEPVACPGRKSAGRPRQILASDMGNREGGESSACPAPKSAGCPRRGPVCDWTDHGGGNADSGDGPTDARQVPDAWPRPEGEALLGRERSASGAGQPHEPRSGAYQRQRELGENGDESRHGDRGEPDRKEGEPVACPSHKSAGRPRQGTACDKVNPCASEDVSGPGPADAPNREEALLGSSETKKGASADASEVLEEPYTQLVVEHDDKKENAIIECINITSLETNHNSLLERDADLVFVQEHKLGEAQRIRIGNVFNKCMWNLLCGPCDSTGANNAAGVAAIARPRAKVVHTDIHTPAFREVHEAGRANKCLVDLGWEQTLRIFNIYGKSGNGKEALRTTEAIIDSVREEMLQDGHMATIILRDLNANPEDVESVNELMDIHGWTDIGLHADWWGDQAAANTCQPSPQVKASRLDVILADPEALQWIEGMTVYDDPMIPTHKVLRLKISRKAARETKLHVRNLPSLRSMFMEEVERRKKADPEKKPAEVCKEARKRLQEGMDEEINRGKSYLQQFAEEGDIDAYWKRWSKLVEFAWLKFLGQDKCWDRRLKGRGQVNLIEKMPSKPGDRSKPVGNFRCEDMTKALNYQKQARRCEQLAFRIGLIAKGQDSAEKVQKFRSLNRQAERQIVKHRTDLEWEEYIPLKTQVEDFADNVMMVPTIKIWANKYQAMYQSHKEKAKKEEEEKCMQAIYSSKQHGKNKLGKSIKEPGTMPLTAAKGMRQGPQGQLTGTTATLASAVDEIIRTAMAKVYRGNVEDTHETADRYMQEYSQFIFRMKRGGDPTYNN